MEVNWIIRDYMKQKRMGCKLHPDFYESLLQTCPSPMDRFELFEAFRKKTKHKEIFESNIEALSGDLKGAFKVRIGNYRAIAVFLHGIYCFVHIGKRSDVYDKGDTNKKLRKIIKSIPRLSAEELNGLCSDMTGIVFSDELREPVVNSDYSNYPNYETFFEDEDKVELSVLTTSQSKFESVISIKYDVYHSDLKELGLSEELIERYLQFENENDLLHFIIDVSQDERVMALIQLKEKERISMTEELLNKLYTSNEVDNHTSTIFSDKLIELKVSKDLDISIEQITEGDIEGIDSFEFIGTDTFKLHDISDISKMKNLRRLNLSNNAIVDLTPLSKLENLRIVVLKENLIQDISEIMKMEKIWEMDVSGNNIRNIHIDVSNSCLESLNISNNQIEKIEGLDGLTSLYSLNLIGNKLTEIDIRSCRHIDELLLDPIRLGIDSKHYYSLKTKNFSIPHVQFKSLVLKKIMQTIFGYGEQEVLFQDASKLISLYINLEDGKFKVEYMFSDDRDEYVFELSFEEGQRIEDLSGLEACINLSDLEINDQYLIDLLPLEKLTKLKKLNLEDNGIVCLQGLEKLGHLEVLNLDSNNIHDLMPLVQNVELRVLGLSNNAIIDLSPLNSLDKLRILRLARNQIVDISPLRNLVNLTALDLKENFIFDISILSNHLNLIELFISNNKWCHTSDLSLIYSNLMNKDFEIVRFSEIHAKLSKIHGSMLMSYEHSVVLELLNYHATNMKTNIIQYISKKPQFLGASKKTNMRIGFELVGSIALSLLNAERFIALYPWLELKDVPELGIMYHHSSMFKNLEAIALTKEHVIIKKLLGNPNIHRISINSSCNITVNDNILDVNDVQVELQSEFTKRDSDEFCALLREYVYECVNCQNSTMYIPT